MSPLLKLVVIWLLSVIVVCSSDDPGAAQVVADQTKEEEVVIYKTPNLDLENLPYFLYESFDDEVAFNSKWIRSKSTKADSQDAKYDGEWNLGQSHSKIQGDSCLLLSGRAKHHAISSKTKSNIVFEKNQAVILQYDVQFRDGQECGGAYVKLISLPSGNLDSLNDKSTYSIMFGPDKCGNDYKLHLIFNHVNPKNGSVREIHWKKASSVSKLEEVVKDGKWHHLRLHLRNDNSFEIQLDKKIVTKGSLLLDFVPPVNPPETIDDLSDSKPEDWDERERIADPDDVKPDDWDENEPRKVPDSSAVKPFDWNDDEPEMIPDPESTKPSDWDPDMDGEWEPPLIANPRCSDISGCGSWRPPLIDNPNYKGKWKPRMIANPNFKGKWSPRKIPNPEYFQDKDPYGRMMPIDALAFELWSISDNIAFDNILLTNNVDTANYVVDHTFQIKKDLADEETDSLIVKLIKATNKKPWLWAVYFLAIAIPVILFIAYCCIVPVKKSEDEKISRSKKSDAVTPDDEQRTVEQVAEPEQPVRSSPPRTNSGPQTRSSLPKEVLEPEETEELVTEEEELDEEREENEVEEEEGEQDEENEIEEHEEDEKEVKQTTRRRTNRGSK